MKYVRTPLVIALAMAAALSAFSPVRAAGSGEQWMSFAPCTNNRAGDVTIGLTQLYVQVSVLPSGQIRFHFINTGPAASSITDVYLDDDGGGYLLNTFTVIDGPGVDFAPIASPGNLPGRNNCAPAFQTTDGFSADSEPPTQPNGVNPGEYLNIDFALGAGQTPASVMAALAGGSLRIGIHVQGFAGGGSESFVSEPPTAVSLASFSATAGRGQVTLHWATGAETDNAGFNLYRATSPDGVRVKVTPQLIGAKGNDVSGASYSSLDVSGYGFFYYWLEDVDYTGRSTLHGPLPVGVRPSLLRPIYRPTLPGGSR